jgi:hypothetical protein
LPACGSQNTVKNDQNKETVLNPETTPVSSGTENLGVPGENTSINTYVKNGNQSPTKSYVEKIHRTKGPKSKTTITTTPVTSNENVETPVPTTVTTPKETPQVESPAPMKKAGGSHWLLWTLVVLVLAGIGYYFWNKSQDNKPPTMPAPPTGGLSPVSGFTAIKGKIEDLEKRKPSIWFKKIF